MNLLNIAAFSWKSESFCAVKSPNLIIVRQSDNIGVCNDSAKLLKNDEYEDKMYGD